MSRQSRTRPLMLGIAFLAFISIGVPDAVLGVAWPSIRQTFGLAVSQLGALLISGMVGYLVSCFYGGMLIERLGVGKLLAVSSIAITAVACANALAPAWGVMVGFGLLSGLGAGAIDAGLNVYAARHFSPQVMNWMHACYGIGAAAGPAMMTGVLVAGLSWRWGYAGIAVLLAAMTICFFVTLRMWEDGSAEADKDPAAALRARADAMRRPLVWMHTGLFFAYAGVEATAGQWSYSLLTEGRGMSPQLAGAAVSLFWASLTIGRIGFGALSARSRTDSILRGTMLVCPVAAAVLWADVAPPVNVLSLALLGLACAPIFPLLISVTPVRVGEMHSSHTIGFQVAAAYLGIAGIPAITGVLARWISLEVVGPIILVSSIGVLILHEIVLRRVQSGQSLAAALIRPEAAG